MPDDLVTSARDTVSSLVQAARCCAKHPPGHPRRTESFEFLAIRATNYGERWGELRLEVVPPKALAVMGTPVHEDDGADGLPLAHAIMGAGIRSITLGVGIAREELQQLTEVLGRAGHGDEDIVCGLW